MSQDARQRCGQTGSACRRRQDHWNHAPVARANCAAGNATRHPDYCCSRPLAIVPPEENRTGPTHLGWPPAPARSQRPYGSRNRGSRVPSAAALRDVGTGHRLARLSHLQVREPKISAAWLPALGYGTGKALISARSGPETRSRAGCYDGLVSSRFPLSKAGLQLWTPVLLLAFLLAAGPDCASATEWPGSAKIDAAINDAIAQGITPGAVVWIESRHRRLHFASYGFRSLEPSRESMTQNTIFDCASLTKVMVTAPAIMMLVENGKVRLNDRIQAYLPDFQDSTRITVRQLLTHFSGLRPTLPLEPAWTGYEAGVALALQERPAHPPDSKFVYSDINYILLAEIVRRTSGLTIDQFAKQRIFEPLGMTDTMYLPPGRVRSRIAPTEKLEVGTVLRGVVHDPTTRMMGGVSGQAGVFSTAVDVARFARMMLSGGELDAVRILSPLSVLRMRTPQSPKDKAARGIGWDIDTPYSSPRGDLFGTSSFGHTGYTGPSLWIDPVSDSFVVLMTNRVHPKAGTSVVRLRSLVASIAAANLDDSYAPGAGGVPSGKDRRDTPVFSNVRTGLDVLADEDFGRLRGKRLGLITNQTGIDRSGRRNIDLLHQAPDVSLQLIFAPEHGLAGTLDQPEIQDGVDSSTGIKAYSLYQSGRRRPPEELLEGLDALVFDVQDIGARFYTYVTTMGYAMEAAAQAGIDFFVLDRPNPINGNAVQGPVLDADLESFVGYHRIPVRHGMTVGELAMMFNEERRIGANVTVVRMQGWRRSLWFDETGLPWVNPSPNIRTLDQAILYPGIALLEWLPDYSVGRGTDTPFQFVGADWIVGANLADAIRQFRLPGIRAYARKLRPRASIFKDKMIDGVQFSITDRDTFDPTHFGLALAAALRTLYADQVDFNRTDKLIGNRTVVDDLTQGSNFRETTARLAGTLEDFRERRSRYLLY